MMAAQPGGATEEAPDTSTELQQSCNRAAPTSQHTSASRDALAPSVHTHTHTHTASVDCDEPLSSARQHGGGGGGGGRRGPVRATGPPRFAAGIASGARQAVEEESARDLGEAQRNKTATSGGGGAGGGSKGAADFISSIMGGAQEARSGGGRGVGGGGGGGGGGVQYVGASSSAALDSSLDRSLECETLL
jgi:hypothetical protein